MPRELSKLDRAYADIKKRKFPLNPEDLSKVKEELYADIRNRRLLIHRRNHCSNVEKNKAFLRIFYVRYTDNWILLYNGDRQLGSKLKSLISVWLRDNLKATLAEDKTVITDLRNRHALFLGYELTDHREGWMHYIHQGDRKKLFYADSAPTLRFPPLKKDS